MTPAFGGQYSIQLSYGRCVGALFYSLSHSRKITHFDRGDLIDEVIANRQLT